MTEQEKREIEEMARSLGCGSGERVRCSDCDCTNYQLAKKLYQAGYRKIPKDAIVLFVGKENQALDEKTIEYFVKHNEKVRKETAREIFEKSREKCMFDGYPYGIDYKEICEIVKKYGVEVEE